MRVVGKNNDYSLMGAQLSYVTERNMSFRDKYEAGDDKKEFENNRRDKAFRCEQEKKTADLARDCTCRT